jgi:hypothetical protein
MKAHQGEQAELQLKVRVPVVRFGFGSRQQNAARSHHDETNSLPVAQLSDHIRRRLTGHGKREQPQVGHQNCAAEQPDRGQMSRQNDWIGQRRFTNRGK